ncbi:polyadenylate-binding protein-interacting protein 5 [Cynara cardunculus var. scolymus]|uniref:Ubiquitin system component Cue n=1 Tax=Cynara cardunculus var. scolymus TaxID=59895 RepID=A0A103T7P5_CYNCS|nr:polyadenylate-binding protein-interacting protein 5 [Cynara cardunculus var. scolymus]KVH08887.1 Ubiquitin system component Cue [Cynara cardunculus var. scolymus]
MKARASSLNPYATSYVPLSRRGPNDESKGHESTVTDSKMRNQAAWLAYDPGSTTQNYDASTAVPDSPDSLKLKNHSVFGSSSHSAELAGKQAMDVDHDMNLAYLQMIFSGVSDESLSSVYTANGGDMEATVEMLNQLEVHSGDFSENLPESLDIGDVSEAGSSSEGGSQKLKKVAAIGEGSW